MTLRQVMATLKRQGSAQNRKIYQRHGAGENTFGVSFANLRKLAKSIGTDQDLAEQLWATGNVDARALATMVADPTRFKAKQIDEWLRDLDYYLLVGLLADSIVAKTRFARSRADKWRKSKSQWTAQAGWNVTTALAMNDDETGDDYFSALLEIIEADIHGAANRARHAMNGSLIAIGGRNPTLRKRALAAAKRIGKVEVDHGETGCKTPDAAAYIERIWAHKAKLRSAAKARTAAGKR